MELSDILKEALQALKKEDQFDKCLDYLKSEWYNTTDELRLALNDTGAWSDVQLPGRLKLELKKILLKENIVKKSSTPSTSSSSTSLSQSAPATSQATFKWTKCFSPEHNHYYYFNNESLLTQWAEPSEPYDDDPSMYTIETTLGASKQDASATIQNPKNLRKAEIASIKASFDDITIDDNFESFESFQSPCGVLPSGYDHTTVEVSPTAYPVLPTCPPFTLSSSATLYRPTSILNDGISPEFQRWDDGVARHFITAEAEPAIAVRLTGDDGVEEHKATPLYSQSTLDGSVASRRGATSLFRSATKGVLNAMGVRHPSATAESISSGGSTPELPDDENYDEHIRILCEMGFTAEAASIALVENSNDLAASAAYLVNPNKTREEIQSSDPTSSAVRITVPTSAAPLSPPPSTGPRKFTVPLARVNIFGFSNSTK